MNVRLMNARVLVTGARGFIGSRLCARLSEQGASVTGITSAADVPSNGSIDWLTSDLADLEKVRGLIDRVKPDLVFHLAGHVTGAQGVANVPPTFAVNLGSTVHMLTAVTEAGARPVVLAGSMQETDDFDTVACSPYAASKSACGIYARMFHGLYGLPVAIARPMMVYGPGQWDNSKLLPYVITSLLAGVSPAVASGARVLDWVFIDDVVDGLLAIAGSPKTAGQAVDLGSGVLTSVRDLVLQLGATIDPRVPIRFGAVPDRKLERPRAARVQETEDLIDWRATTVLEQGLAATIDWYRESCCSPRLA